MFEVGPATGAELRKNANPKRSWNPLIKDARGNSYIGIDCTIQAHWSMGTRNLILEARFTDGVRWVLKIFMLETIDGPVASLTPHLTKTPMGIRFTKLFKREFEAMEFIRFVSLTSSKILYSDLNGVHTKLLVPAPHFITRLPSSRGRIWLWNWFKVSLVLISSIYNTRKEA